MDEQQLAVEQLLEQEREAQLQEGDETQEDKWLTFKLAGQLFGVSILSAEQIVGIQPITEIPESPAYMKGVINLRGNIVPLMDLRLRLGKNEKEYDEHTSIIINKVGESQFGIIVDEVDAVENIPDERIAQAPQFTRDTAKQYLIGITQLPGVMGGPERSVLLIDAVKLFDQSELGIVSANTAE